MHLLEIMSSDNKINCVGENSDIISAEISEDEEEIQQLVLK